VSGSRRPRCGRPLLRYKLISRTRDRNYSGRPACGRPEDHRGHCLSEDAWKRDKDARRLRYAQLRRKAPGITQEAARAA